MKLNSKLATLVVGVLVLFVAVRVVLAQTQLDFTLHNHTERVIDQIHISGHEIEAWGEDVLGTEVLAQGESAEIKFSQGEVSESYDVRVQFEDKTVGIWSDIDLTELTDLTIFYKEGKPWAKKENK